MTDDNDCALEVFGEKLFEPTSSLDVKVIGWFVEQQNVGVRQEQTRERKTRLLSAGKFLHRDVEVVVGESQSVQRGVNLVIDCVATSGFDGFFDRDLAKQQFVEFAAIGSGHAFEHAFEFLLMNLDRSERFGSGLTQCLVGGEPRILLEVTHAHTARDLHFALIRLDDPRDQLEERALAAAVAPDESDALALMNRTAHAIKKKTRAVAVTKI